MFYQLTYMYITFPRILGEFNQKHTFFFILPKTNTHHKWSFSIYMYN